MVLKVGNEVVAQFDCVGQLFRNHSDLRQRSEEFCRTPVKTVAKRDKCVYIGQREMGILKVSDEKIDSLGSEDATTCHIAIVKENLSGTCGLAHLDSSENNQLEVLVTNLLHETASENRDGDKPVDLEISLIGGYDDERGTSSKITELVMDYMISDLNVVFHLTLLCIGELNTRIVKKTDEYPAPIHYGVAVNIRSGHIFPAKFAYHGPDPDIRSLQTRTLTKVYSSSTGKFLIPVFEYEAFSSAHLWLEVSDEYMLSKLSTSPKVEPADFCDNMRNLFKRMISDPRPLKSIFKNNCDRIYSLNEESGEWELDNPDLYTVTSPDSNNHTSFSVRDFISTTKKL